MAKRKAARSTAGRAAAKRARAGGSRGGAKKKKKASARGRAGKAQKTAARRSASGRKTAGRKTTGRKAAGARARKAAGKRPSARKQAAARKAAPRRPSGTRRATPRSADGTKPTVPLRKSPALDRPRRTVAEEEDIVQTPPSSLDLDRSASAARTGRRSLRDRYDEHTETGPALTGGDVDADWESAYSVGDEAPGGDNPTPDQDIVDDIGRAVGIEYQDNEELKGADKLEKRDRKRWELDPASSEDWDER